MPLRKIIPTIVTENPPILLASASPRRHELLLQLGVKHDIRAVDIDETCLAREAVDACIERLALNKARAGLLCVPQAIVIGSDTMVIVDETRLGKPRDRADALQMLECLSGRAHEVLTAVAVIDASMEFSCVQRSKVVFRRLSSDEMVSYWASGEPVGKAGGYAIQGIAGQFVERLEGSYSSVMGLPLFETAQLLKEFGINTLKKTGNT